MVLVRIILPLRQIQKMEVSKFTQQINLQLLASPEAVSANVCALIVPPTRMLLSAPV